MANTLIHQQWFFIALVFFGIIGYIAWIRWRDRRWIETRFGKEIPLAMSFGVNYYGRATEPGKPRRSSGFLLLFPDRLFYRSRLAGHEVDIPIESVHQVSHGSTHKGVDLHQSVVIIDFSSADGQKDSAAFKVPYPPQWIQAIESAVIATKSTASQ